MGLLEDCSVVRFMKGEALKLTLCVLQEFCIWTVFPHMPRSIGLDLRLKIPMKGPREQKL